MAKRITKKATGKTLTVKQASRRTTPHKADVKEIARHVTRRYEKALRKLENH